MADRPWWEDLILPLVEVSENSDDECSSPLVEHIRVVKRKPCPRYEDIDEERNTPLAAASGWEPSSEDAALLNRRHLGGRATWLRAAQDRRAGLGSLQARPRPRQKGRAARGPRPASAAASTAVDTAGATAASAAIPRASGAPAPTAAARRAGPVIPQPPAPAGVAGSSPLPWWHSAIFSPCQDHVLGWPQPY